MSLDADIARIAALRGRKASDYANPPSKPKPRREHVERIFHMGPDGKTDVLAVDALPAASRAFLRESPRQINALIWADLLANYAETDLIEAARSMIRWPSPPPPSSPRSRHRR